MQQLVSFFLKHRLIAHSVFWLIVLIFTYIFWGLEDGYYLQYFYITCLITAVKMGVVYLNLYLLMPRLLLQGKYINYILALIVLLALGSVLYRVIHSIFYPIFYPNETYPFALSAEVVIKTSIYFFNPILVFTTGVKLLKNWFVDKEKKTELEKQALFSELNYLKAQIHPHFFFNTLNNLYSLTVQKSEEAPKVVLKLSEVMQYMLYHTSADKIALQKEIEHINNYIELEKLRYGDRLDLNFSINSPIDGKMIAPLILIPFVENAFKHGISNELNKCWIAINLKVKNETLFFKVENSYAHEQGSNDESGYQNGIGLKNVKRRLDLLYQDRYELSMVKEANAHWVDLKVQLV